MPSFTFKCKECENRFTIIKSIHEDFDDNMKCDKCGSNDIMRVYNNVTFINKMTDMCGKIGK